MVLDGYPGVYIQEVPSGVRPIVAASTSTLAVLGHFPRGPVGTPIRVTSWNDVVRSFGALDRRYVALYTLQDFFQQGGSYAWVSRIAFDRPTLTLSSVEQAMVVEAREAGAGGNTITTAIERNADGSFDLIVTGDGGTSTFPSLSEDPASPRFVERIVNAPPDEGGSPLVRVRDTRFAPAELAAVALAGGLDGGEGEDGAAGAPATLPLASLPQPALTLQGLEGWTSDVRVSATANGEAFDLVFTNVAGADEPFELVGLSLSPGESYVVDRVASVVDGQNRRVAAVVAGRHPLRAPVDHVSPSDADEGEGEDGGDGDGDGSPVPSELASVPNNSGVAFTENPRPGVAGVVILRGGNAGAALTVGAASPGAWGNGLRVGIARTPGGFDLRIDEYHGSELVGSETFRNLSITASDARHAVKVVEEQSRLVRISGLEAAPAESAPGTAVDDLTFAQLQPLAGGTDGTLPGEPAWAGNASGVFEGQTDPAQGITALDAIVPERFNLLVIPEAPLLADKGYATYAAAGAYCRGALAFLLVDHPEANDGVEAIAGWDIAGRLGADLARSAAICFPRLAKADPLGGQRAMQASGAIAGLMARIDGQRGVWKAPAGLDASIGGMLPSVGMTDRQQAALNKRGINCMRVKPGAGTVQWGARTLAGADILASEWKYVPVRRTALMIEQTLQDALGWVVFEPNDESLWAQIRLNVGAFMQSLFAQGAFQGKSPREAYLVKCDAETTSQQDVNTGIVNILVGFAPLRPAEFVVVRLTQLAGRLAS